MRFWFLDCECSDSELTDTFAEDPMEVLNREIQLCDEQQREYAELASYSV